MTAQDEAYRLECLQAIAHVDCPQTDCAAVPVLAGTGCVGREQQTEAPAHRQRVGAYRVWLAAQ